MTRMKWEDVVEHPSVNVIMGFRRRGKSALGFYLLEALAKKYGLEKVVYAFPRSEKHLLPDDYVIASSIEEIPKNSIVFVDEVFLFAHSRRSMANSNLLFDQLTAMSGKNKQIVIYATHHSRKMDRNLILDCDNLIYKKPSALQIEMERTEVRKFSKRAYEKLKGKGKEWSYVFSFVNDVEGLLRNDLPSFWCDDISNVEYSVNELVEEEEEEFIDDLDVDYGFDEDELFSYPPDKRAAVIFSLPKKSKKRRILFNKHLELCNENK